MRTFEARQVENKYFGDYFSIPGQGEVKYSKKRRTLELTLFYCEVSKRGLHFVFSV